MTGKTETFDHVVHIGATKRFIDRRRDEARASGQTIIDLDLGGLSSREELVQRLVEVFHFPYPSSGLDSVVDFISDLEWFGDARGFLIIVDCADASPGLVSDLASMLPAIVDRRRSRSKPFVAVIGHTPHQIVLQDSLEEANSTIDQAGALSWAQPGTRGIPVVQH